MMPESKLKEACALYERSGFEPVVVFNDEPYSDRWYTKALTRASGKRPSDAGTHGAGVDSVKR